MLKCKTCKFYHICQGRLNETVNECARYKSVEQTNEEYLRSANVNDMARCIATKLLELARHEYGIYDVVDYATIFEWLKEKHE